MEVLTAAQMRAIEQAAIYSGAVTGLELMERAGQAVVDAIFEEWPELQTGARRAVVLCGPGNNGGDGFVVARLLHELDWVCEVLLYGDPQKLPPDAQENHDKWTRMGRVQSRAINPPPLVDDSLNIRACDVLIDALFGIGLTRAFQGVFSLLSHPGIDQLMAEKGTRRVAIDVPSGLCADSGKILGASLRADLTITFHRSKPGHYIAGGPGACGRLKIADIGIDLSSVSNVPTSDICLLDASSKTLLRVSKTHGHKLSHGHALILTGGFGKTGAARLAGQGALRIGAGLVTLGVPGSAQMEVASQITALMMTRVDTAEDLEAVLKDERITALCLGPGLGHARAKEVIPVALASKRKTCLDADALSAYAEAPQDLFDVLHEDCVLTPHGGEFARLFPGISEKLNAPAETGPAYSKVDATREAAQRAGCTVLFKGPDTVISNPNGITRINASVRERAAPWLATAGSGDVLAGFITGLLARDFDPLSAAEIGAYLHTDCALTFGPGLIAEDLPTTLPKVLKGYSPQRAGTR